MGHKFTCVNHLKEYSVVGKGGGTWLLCHACKYESNQQEHVARQLQSQGGVCVCLLKHIPLSYNTTNGCHPPRKLHIIMDTNQDFC